jgi:predicted RNA-binding Zn ribbon-like protein
VDFTSYAQGAAALVNARLDSEADLQTHLQTRPWLGSRATADDLAPLRALQHGLGALVDASAAGDGGEVVRRLNELLGDHPVRPRVSGHDETTWHLHVNDESASVAETLSSEALLGLAILVTEMGATRLGSCAASNCGNAFVDTSANSSRRFCSTRCSTRMNVAALRRRKQQVSPG